jgi:hypothetical protein
VGLVIGSTSLPARYEAPAIRDFGTLEELTAASLLSPNAFSTVAAVTAPIGGPGGGGAGGVQGASTPNSPGAGDVGDLNSGGGGASPGAGVGAGGAGSGPGGGGSGGGGAGGGGGGGGHLPFTGYPVAFAAAVGGALVASGAAIRRKLTRQPQG